MSALRNAPVAAIVSLVTGLFSIGCIAEKADANAVDEPTAAANVDEGVTSVSTNDDAAPTGRAQEAFGFGGWGHGGDGGWGHGGDGGWGHGGDGGWGHGGGWGGAGHWGGWGGAGHWGGWGGAGLGGLSGWSGCSLPAGHPGGWW